MAKPTINPNGFMSIIEERCWNCKHFEVHDDVFKCKLESFECRHEPRLYELLHVKYCKDCLYHRNTNELCIKNDIKRGCFDNPCISFKYVHKSYND